MILQQERMISEAKEMTEKRIHSPRWASKFRFKKHRNSFDRSIKKLDPNGEYISSEARKLIHKALTGADDNQFQTVENSFRHGMRDGKNKQTVDQAREKTNQFVINNLKEARNDQTNNKWQKFGYALHAVQDTTSQSHCGYQAWEGHMSISHILADISFKTQNLDVATYNFLKDYINNVNYDNVDANYIGVLTKHVSDNCVTR